MCPAEREDTMAKGRKKRSEEEVIESTPPTITEADIKQALKQAAAGANDLHEQLKEVFVLNDASATLRLR